VGIALHMLQITGLICLVTLSIHVNNSKSNKNDVEMCCTSLGVGIGKRGILKYKRVHRHFSDCVSLFHADLYLSLENNFGDIDT
jgi:hypothetical protein